VSLGHHGERVLDREALDDAEEDLDDVLALVDRVVVEEDAVGGGLGLLRGLPAAEGG
jgi:hypothetical protein